ncbi:MAG TPA: hypothetical protein PLC42_07775 [Parachlamydiaceae bacterium]|nr:hypothetical protein [Parachlamydiaceae bacterium]
MHTFFFFCYFLFIQMFLSASDEEGIIVKYYDSGKDVGRIQEEIQLLEDGEPIAIRRYFYEEGCTIVYDLFDNKTVYRNDEAGVVTSIEKYDAKNHLISTERFLVEDGEVTKLLEDARGNPVICERSIYDSKGNCLAKKTYSDIESLSQKVEEDILPVNSTFSYLNSLLKRANLPNIQEMINACLGSDYLVLTGYYNHPLESGVFGYGEINDKVRVTFINGILNRNSDCLATAQMISKTHGGVNVHYIYRRTKGWAEDLHGSVSVWFGSVTPEARLLAKRWKELIAEMGGPNEGGIIFHYGHSIGGSETWNARTLLTKEEKTMIRVVTIGSPFMIHKDGLHSVVNYASVRDGVSLISLLDPVGYFKDGGYNVVLVGSLFEGVPLVDHPIYSPNYLNIFHILGKQFIDSFGRVQEEL